MDEGTGKGEMMRQRKANFFEQGGNSFLARIGDLFAPKDQCCLDL